jgi:hypothetical protein
MVTLGIGISDARLADLQHFFQHSRVGQRRLTQLNPILAFAARDYVVNSGQGELLMGKVTV